MADEDPFAPRREQAPVSLERMSIEELEARVHALKAEIAACEASIAAKKAQRAAADAVFGGSNG